MNRKLSALLFVVAFWVPGLMHAQNSNGIIASSRAVDWSQAGVIGGIPNRTSICTTLSPGASASTINSAIASCPSNQVVYLKAGTYNLSSGINFGGHSNVTLRGAGPDQTFLIFSSGTGCGTQSANICVAGSAINSSPSNLATVNSGYSQGSTTVSLSSTNNLSVGSLIDFDQLNDSSDTGSVFVCDTTGVCSTEGTGGVYRSGRGQNHVAIVTAISGSNVSFFPGFYLNNWSSSKSPQAYWPTNTITENGVEDLSIDNSGSSSNAAVLFYSATNSWVKNVRSLYLNRDDVMTWVASHISVVSNYFYGTQRGSTTEYGVEADRSSNVLVANNIFQHVVAPITPGGGDTGSVYAYNYATDFWYTNSSNWLMPLFDPHGAGIAFDLAEGNVGGGVESDAIHGTHNFLTFFRNRFDGIDASNSNITNHTIPIELWAFSRYYNVIGNVLGQPGYHTQYEDLEPNGSNAAKSIYVLGWGGINGGSSSIPNDPKVAQTLMRWGNYDVVTGAVRWDTSEVPSGLSQFANPVPSSQTLPASFFLSSKPSWWGTPWGNPPWPAIGPDVTGGPGPGGHSYAIPAQLCYEHTSKNSSGILNFNADSCYSSSPAPSAPIGLIASPH